VTTTFTHQIEACGQNISHYEMPPIEVILAAQAVHQWFAEHNISEWELGGCRSRFPLPGAVPTHTINAAGTVAVSNEVFIDPDMSTCPRGVKVQLEGKGGILLYGTYDGKDPFFVGWAPLPRRRPK